jgi:hypothetical protein
MLRKGSIGIGWRFSVGCKGLVGIGIILLLWGMIGR